MTKSNVFVIFYIYHKMITLYYANVTFSTANNSEIKKIQYPLRIAAYALELGDAPGRQE